MSAPRRCLRPRRRRDGRGRRRAVRLDAGPDRRRRRRARRSPARCSRGAAARPISGAARGCRFLAPLPEPRQMRDGMSYRDPYPPVRRAARGREARRGGRGGGLRGGYGRAARGAAADLSADADLLHHQPDDRRRPRSDRRVASLQPGDGLRTRNRDRHRAARAPTSRRAKRAPTSSATRSSTTFRRATGRRWRCRAGSDRPRARASTARNAHGPLDRHRPTRSAIRRR